MLLREGAACCHPSGDFDCLLVLAAAALVPPHLLAAALLAAELVPPHQLAAAALVPLHQLAAALVPAHQVAAALVPPHQLRTLLRECQEAADHHRRRQIDICAGELGFSHPARRPF
jgi:hypothetical protein